MNKATKQNKRANNSFCNSTNYGCCEACNDSDDKIYTILESLEAEDLPYFFEADNPEDINTDTIEGFCNKVREHKGFGCVFNFFTCEDCGRLHCVIEINND